MTTHMHVQLNRNGLTRRTFLRSVAVGAAACGVLGWKDAVTLAADELRKRGMACILLFMRGGPSQMETFDPKPGTDNGGPTKAIDTAVGGIKIAEHWPTVARQMKDIALIRSMTNKEGEHQRALYQMHTGYVPGGAVKYPSLGSIVASEIAPKDFDLPGFVSIGNRQGVIGSGFLGASAAPFVVANPLQMPTNVELPSGVNDKRFERRLGLLDDLEQDFANSGGKALVDSHRTLYADAAQMVLSPRLKAFDLTQEKEDLRERYGSSSNGRGSGGFGQGCLLARRLVEAGVTFVEVEAGGWDTHQDNFERVKNLAGEVDPAVGTLIQDLRERGMLQRTLVLWAGEFGRTPRINPNTGRDHYPRAFNVMLAGGGVKGGQVVGKTSDDGMEVKERPVGVTDLFSTICAALKIDSKKENLTPIGRPIKIVDGGTPVKELLG